MHGCYDRVMRMPCLCVAACALVLPAGASATAPASAHAHPALHPFETCLTAKALQLEPSGAEIDRVLGDARRACRSSRGELAEPALAEIELRARLAAMQQRLNARNTRRRG